LYIEPLPEGYWHQHTWETEPDYWIYQITSKAHHHHNTYLIEQPLSRDDVVNGYNCYTYPNRRFFPWIKERVKKRVEKREEERVPITPFSLKTLTPIGVWEHDLS
jgi:hypothetical protein